jgi:hypothetical protein
MSRSVHKPATVIGSSIPGKDLSSGGVQHEGFVEMEENGDKSADISCDDDLEREEITAALADVENQADMCMREEEETEIADGDSRLDNTEKQAPALNLGELLRAQNVDRTSYVSRTKCADPSFGARHANCSERRAGCDYVCGAGEEALLRESFVIDRHSSALN